LALSAKKRHINGIPLIEHYTLGVLEVVGQELDRPAVPEVPRSVFWAMVGGCIVATLLGFSSSEANRITSCQGEQLLHLPFSARHPALAARRHKRGHDMPAKIWQPAFRTRRSLIKIRIFLGEIHSRCA
jgi:hypothetical protein